MAAPHIYAFLPGTTPRDLEGHTLAEIDRLVAGAMRRMEWSTDRLMMAQGVKPENFRQAFGRGYGESIVPGYRTDDGD